jgi:CRISPR/Cas system-associated protein Cas10 (large subunit of type III CRISPR-Cas system)
MVKNVKLMIMEGTFMKLISFLGTGDYKNALYHFKNRNYETPFIQEALVKLLPEISDVIVFTTPEAKEKNGTKLLSVCVADHAL